MDNIERIELLQKLKQSLEEELRGLIGESNSTSVISPFTTMGHICQPFPVIDVVAFLLKKANLKDSPAKKRAEQIAKELDYIKEMISHYK